MAAQHIESRSLEVRRERSRAALLRAATRADVAFLSPSALCAAADLSRHTFLSHFADLADLAAFIVLRTFDLAELNIAELERAHQLPALTATPLRPYQRLFKTVIENGSADVEMRLQQRLLARRQLTRERLEGAVRLVRQTAALEHAAVD